MNDPKIQKILVPIDFSEITPHVIGHAAYLARIMSCELLLLHVVHVPPLAEASTWLEPVISPSVEQDINRQLEKSAEAKLKELARELEPGGVRLKIMIRHGVPFAEIIKCADENQADLIVMGSQGRSGLSHFLIGSVAERVVRRARCHVYCVKPGPGTEDQ